MPKKNSTKSLSGYTYSSAISNHKEITETDRLAKEAGMTYGQYVAMMYVKKHARTVLHN